jgi:kynurenine formamidase
MNRISALGAVVVLAACTGPPSGSSPDFSPVFDGSGGTWIDLTYPYSDQTVYWPTADGFELEEVSYGPTPGGWFYAAYNFSSSEHGGTHLDAPIHFAEGRQTNDQIPLSRLIGPAVVVSLADPVDPDAMLTVEDLARWEGTHGSIPDGAILLVRSGWGGRYHDRTAYLGTDLTGPEAVPELHFPGIAPEAAEWLVAERRIAAVGIDTPSIDRGQSTDFRSHVILYGEDIPGFENVANLDRLPSTGSYVVALPMMIEGGSGGPLRIVAFLPAPA